MCVWTLRLEGPGVARETSLWYLSPLLSVRSLDPVSIFCSSLGDSSFFPQLFFPPDISCSPLLPYESNSFIFSCSPYLVPNLWCLSSRRLSRLPCWGQPCSVCPALQQMTTPPPFPRYHGLMPLSWRLLQSVLLPGPFFTETKLFPSDFVQFPSSHSPSMESLPRVLVAAALLHQSCPVLKLPLQPPLPCCRMYAAPGRISFISSADPLNHGFKGLSYLFSYLFSQLICVSLNYVGTCNVMYI